MTRNIHRRRQDAVQLPAFAGSVGYIVWSILASSAAAPADFRTASLPADYYNTMTQGRDAEGPRDNVQNSTPAYVTGIARTSMQTRDPTRGSYHLWEAYSELDVPLLAYLPAVQSLDLNVAARYSDYSSTRSDTTTKLGLAWRPVSELLLRGTYSEGFRAPSILELRGENFPAVRGNHDKNWEELSGQACS